MSRRSPSAVPTDHQWQLSTFRSELGWFGLVGCGNLVWSLTFGHRTPEEVQERFVAEGVISRLTPPVDWWPQLRERLQAYAERGEDDFTDISVIDAATTRFQRRVITALRRVGLGQTLSYADLARRAGSPGAARAVGRVMATNRVPIIIPCHRVVGSGGTLGGYSTPSGLTMKRRLLALEGVEGFCLEVA